MPLNILFLKEQFLNRKHFYTIGPLKTKYRPFKRSMYSTVFEQGEITHQYKKVQRRLKRLIVTVFPDKKIKYLADYALVQSDDRSLEYIEYVLYHYTYLNNVSALRQKYADLYGTDKPHKFAIDVFTYLTNDAKQFYDNMHHVEMPDIEVKDDYVPSKVLDVPQKSSKNRRKKMKRLQQTEEELFEEMAAYNMEKAKKFTNIWDNLNIVCETLNVKRMEFSTIIQNYLYDMCHTKMHIAWTAERRRIFMYGVFAYTALHTDLSTMERRESGTINKILYKYLVNFYNTFNNGKEPLKFDESPIYTNKDVMITIQAKIHHRIYTLPLSKYLLLSTGFIQMCIAMHLDLAMINNESDTIVLICLKCDNADCSVNKRQKTHNVRALRPIHQICKKCKANIICPNNLCLKCDLLDVHPKKNLNPVPLIGCILELGPEKAKDYLMLSEGDLYIEAL